MENSVKKFLIKKVKRRRPDGFDSGETREKEESDYKGGKLSKIVIDAVVPYIEKINEYGIKNAISRVIPSGDFDYVALNKVKNFLSVRRSIKLGKGLGRVYVQYRRGAVRIEPTGLIRLVIKMISITDQQILNIFDDILFQIQDKYIENSEYVLNKIDNIIADLSDTGIYKPKTPEEKTIYDLVLLVLLNHYEIINDVPHWIKPAIYNLEKAEFIKRWIDSFVTYISGILSNISDNIFFNFKVTFDSMLLRTFLNKKTNKGQISKLLKILDIDINTIISKFSKNYVSPSFLKGMGEIIGNLVSDALSEASEKEEKSKNRECFSENVKSKDGVTNLTMTLGKNPFSQRRFRWYTDENFDYRFIEYGKDRDFKDSIKLEGICISSKIPKPILSLGIISTYREHTVHQYSAQIDNLSENTKYYYRICDKSGNYTGETHSFTTGHNHGEFKFIILADSQGMTKHDYDVFLNLFREAICKFKNLDFALHLGDFVDDGNNENYWDMVLNSEVWAENAVVPLVGNHESKRANFSSNNFIENPISRHFYINTFAHSKESQKEIYYSYIYNNCTFIILDTNDISSEGSLSKRQYRWALKTAKEAKTKWKILVAHKSPYSNGPHHSDHDVCMIGEQIIKIAYETQIDLVIGGHDHVYMRTPVLVKNEECKCKKEIISKEKTDYETFVDPDGTIFIVPGTSGVKNYRQNEFVNIPIEKMINIYKPVYSLVEITDEVIYYTSYSYDKSSSEIIDSFAIKKSNSDSKNISSLDVIRLIDNIPCDSHEIGCEKVERITKYYKNLEYDEKIKVTNYNKLLFFSRMLKCNQKILKGDIISVKTKKEFMNALRSKKIRTIIVDCDEIKFENIFGKKSKCNVTRDLCIRGNAKLSFVNFSVKNSATLILDDTLCIDNSRRIFSSYSSLNTIELHDGCNLIVNGNVSINNSYGLGNKGHSIFVKGINTNVYLNSVCQNYSSKSFLYSDRFDTNVVVNNGSYESGGGKYTFVVKGKIKVNKGYIGSIKILDNSCGTINGGVIGHDNELSAAIPLECEDGIVTISGGKINSRDGISIYGHGENTDILLTPKHRGSLTIDKKIFYLGSIEYCKKNMVKIILSDEFLKKNCPKIYLYFFSYEEYIKKNFSGKKIEISLPLKNSFYLNSSVKTFGTFMQSQCLNKKLEKPILLIDGAKCYISSKNKIL